MGNVCNKDDGSKGAYVFLYHGLWEEAEKFETAYAFDYVEESLARWACRSISRSQPIERKVVLKVSETERRMELYRPLLSESQDEPQPLPFFGGNFYKEVLRDLCVRILFVVPFWAMLTYGYYFQSLVLVLPFLAILNDITKYRYFLSAESQSEAFVMEYIRKLQRSPIAEEGSDGPVLLVEAWHNDDRNGSSTQRLDFREHMYLKHALKAEYTGSTEAEEDIRLALRKAAKEKKALAIESTFFVEIDPDLEKMVVSKLKHMMSKAADKTKLGGSRRALLLLRPHCEYTKLMLSINNARDAQEPGKKGGGEP